MQANQSVWASSPCCCCCCAPATAHPPPVHRYTALPTQPAANNETTNSVQLQTPCKSVDVCVVLYQMRLMQLLTHVTIISFCSRLRCLWCCCTCHTYQPLKRRAAGSSRCLLSAKLRTCAYAQQHTHCCCEACSPYPANCTHPLPPHALCLASL
jgi:hypothetical protein